MSNCGESSSINKTFIIEPLDLTGGTPIFSACTTVYTNLIQSCSGNTFISLGTGIISLGNSNLLTNGSISATTFYGNGSNLSGINNYYTTAATYNGGYVYFNRNDSLSAYTLDLTALSGDSNTFVTGGTLSGNTLVLNRNDNISIGIDLTDIRFSGGSGNCVSDFYVTNIHGCSPVTIFDTLRLLSGLNVTGDTIVNTLTATTIQLLNNNSIYFGDTTRHIQFNNSGLELHNTNNDGYDISLTDSGYFKINATTYLPTLLSNKILITDSNKYLIQLTGTGFLSLYNGDVTYDTTNYLPLSGGTLTGGLSANTISATTYYNLPSNYNDIIGITNNNNNIILTNTSGGTISTLFNTLTGLTINGRLNSNIVSGNSVSANTLYVSGDTQIGVTSANTSGLGILRIAQGISFADFGERNSGTFGIWGQQSLPTNTNYSILMNSSETRFNALTTISLYTSASTRVDIDSSRLLSYVPISATTISAQTLYIQTAYTNIISATTYLNLPSSSSSENYLPLSGGTLTGGVTGTSFISNIISATTVSSYTYNMPTTTASTVGVIYKDGNRFIHNFQHPNGSSAVPDGFNTFIGLNSGNFTMGSNATNTTHSSYNTAVGSNSLVLNSIGYYNTAIGYFSMRNNTSGYTNVAIGNNSLQNNTTGANNVSVGSSSMAANTIGNNNCIIGYAALLNTTGSSNNIVIGDNAARFVTGAVTNLTATTNSIYIGSYASPLANNQTNQIVIGYNAIGNGSNTVTIGNTSTLNNYLFGTLNVSNISGNTSYLYSNSNTGFTVFNASANTAVLSVNTNSNYVGIGTNNPTVALDVVGRINASTIVFATTAIIGTTAQCTQMYPIGDTDLTIMTRPSTGRDIIFKSSGTTQGETMRLTSGGTMVAALISATTISAVTLSANTLLLPNGTNLIQAIDSTGVFRSILDFTSGDNIQLRGRIGTSDIILNPSVSDAGMYVKSNGFVGMGFASPAVRLQVNGNATFSSATSTILRITSGANVQTYLASDGLGTSFGSLTNHNVNFYRNNAIVSSIESNRFRFDLPISGTSISAATAVIGGNGDNGNFTVQASTNSQWFNVNNGIITFNSQGGNTQAGGVDLGARFNIQPINDNSPALAIRGASPFTSDLIRVSSSGLTSGDIFKITGSGNTIARSISASTLSALTLTINQLSATTISAQTSINLLSGSTSIILREQVSTNNAAIYLNQTTPSSTNYALNGTTTTASLNATSQVDIKISDSLVARITNVGIAIDAAKSITFNTTTGGYIGNTNLNKFAFWGTTPIIQPINSTAINKVLSDTGLIQTGATYALFDLPISAQTLFIKTGYTNTLSATTITATSAVLSSLTNTALSVYGSGTTNPVFTVQGSQGELFSINDSLEGSLFSVNDISGLPILEVFSDNTILQGSYQAPSLNTTVKISLTAGSNTIYSIPTSAYTGAFIDYTLMSNSSARAGNIMAIWSGNTAQYTETATNNIGSSTTGITFSVGVSGNYAVLSSSATTSGSTVKCIIRSI